MRVDSNILEVDKNSSAWIFDSLETAPLTHTQKTHKNKQTSETK